MKDEHDEEEEENDDDDDDDVVDDDDDDDAGDGVDLEPYDGHLYPKILHRTCERHQCSNSIIYGDLDLKPSHTRELGVLSTCLHGYVTCVSEVQNPEASRSFHKYALIQNRSFSLIVRTSFGLAVLHCLLGKIIAAAQWTDLHYKSFGFLRPEHS